jgi:methylmalonyl-CoA mutase N-terminal domain/subunit
VAAIEGGFAQRIIADSAWAQQRALEAGDRIVVGVNEYVDEGQDQLVVEPFQLDPGVRERQLERLARVRRERDAGMARAALAAIREAADDDRRNLMLPLEDAVRARCSVGEICNVLRDAWGEYQPPAVY